MKDIVTMLVDKVTVRAILAMGLFGTNAYLVIVGREPSELMKNAFMAAMGFYFAMEVNNRVIARIRSQRKEG